jgi:5-methylcytosine-specific restriction endonuclease McrA
MKHCEKCQATIDAVVERKKKEAQKKRQKRYNLKRDPKTQAFYQSPEWRQLSRAYMYKRGFRCEKCGEIATEVHHKIPLRVDWTKRLDETNLMAVCRKCHVAEERKTHIHIT